MEKVYGLTKNNLRKFETAKKENSLEMKQMKSFDGSYLDNNFFSPTGNHHLDENSFDHLGIEF